MSSMKITDRKSEPPLVLTSHVLSTQEGEAANEGVAKQ